MRCSTCQLENREGRRHCEACGQALLRFCPVCGFLNAVADRHCGGCGVDRRSEARRDVEWLDGAAASPRPLPRARPGASPGAPPPTKPAPRRSDAPAPGAERRQLTVMFCDLANSTAMSRALDPEDLSEVNRAYQTVATQEVERMGGYVARYMGDGILAYFGYPQAHGDDAARAARTALSLVEAVSRLSASIGREKGVDLHARVGIATGLVVVGEVVGEAATREHLVVGETPNLAARLQSIAPLDTVVISEATRRLLDRHFIVEALGDHELKGFAERVPAFRLVGHVEGEDGATDSSVESVAHAPLCGRDAELALLVDRWERAKAGDGQVMLLSGEAGFGKSRLARELCLQVSSQAIEVVRFDSSAFHEGTAFHPVLQSLSRRAGLRLEDEPAERIGKLEALLAKSSADPRAAVALLGPLLALTVPADYPRVELEASARTDQVYSILLDELTDLASRGPLLVIGDGLEGADPTTLGFVDRLVKVAPHHALFVVLTFRPPLPRAWSGLPGVGMLDVGRLRHSDVEAIARAIAGEPPVAPSVLSLVAERTDGVPLFVEELTRTLVSSGQLVQRSGAREFADPTRAAAIPTTIQDSLMARLDRMGEAKALAQVVAVLGREAPLGVLARLLERPVDELGEAIAPLVAGQVLTQTGRGEAALVSFRQALLRDAAYESLLLSRRRELHSRAAAALLEADPQLEVREPEILAHHHAMAGEHPRAIELWERAARSSAARGAPTEGIGHLEAALRAFAELQGELREAPAGIDRELRLHLDLIANCRVTERFDQAMAYLDAAQALAEKHQRLPELARVHSYRGGIHFLSARIEECMRAHSEELRIAELARDPELVAQAHGGVGDAHYQSGDMKRAREHFERCIRVSREHGFTRIEAAHLPMLGIIQSTSMELHDAVLACERGVQLARESGYHRALMLASGTLSQLYYEVGRTSEGDVAFEESVATARLIGSPIFLAVGQLYRGRYLALEGRHAEARTWIERAERVATGAPSFQRMATMLYGAKVLVAEASELEALLREARAVSAARRSFSYWYHPLAIEALLRGRFLDEVAVEVELAESIPFAADIPSLLFHLERARALLAWAERGPDQGIRSELERLLAIARSVGFGSVVPLLEAALDGRWPAEPFRATGDGEPRPTTRRVVTATLN